MLVRSMQAQACRIGTPHSPALRLHVEIKSPSSQNLVRLAEEGAAFSPFSKRELPRRCAGAARWNRRRLLQNEPLIYTELSSRQLFGLLLFMRVAAKAPK